MLCSSEGDGFTIRAHDGATPYDLLMITLVDEIKFGNERKRPFNMVGIENTNTLYISDRNCECIWKIDVVKNEVMKWLSELSDEISLSVTTDNNLLVLWNVADRLHLEIYNQDPIPVTSISLPNSVR